MNLFEVAAKIILDDSEYKKGVEDAQKSGEELTETVEETGKAQEDAAKKSDDLGKAHTETAKKTEKATQAEKKHTDEIENVEKAQEKQEKQTKQVTQAAEKLEKQTKETAKQTEKSADEFEKQTKTEKQSNDVVEKLERRISELENTLKNLQEQTEKSTSKWEKFKNAAKSAGANVKSAAGGIASGVTKIGSVAAKGFGIFTAAAGASVAALSTLEESTEEYRTAMGKLNTAYSAAGMKQETATKAYKGFYEILGDTDTATEASQLLAQLAESEEDVSKWTDIAAGVNGTFGDSLPIEGLIEASNETAKVGQVTGVLADALNWVGVSEDEFNEKLAGCSDESERNALIMTTLNTKYSDASATFKETNATLIASRDAQVKADEAMGKLGDSVSKIKTQFKSDFLPSIADVTTALSDMLEGKEGGAEALSNAISGMVNQAMQKLPEIISFGTTMLTALGQGIIENLPLLIDSAVQIIQQMTASIEENKDEIVKGAFEIINALADGIVELLPDLVKVSIDLLLALAQGLSDNADTILPQITQLISDLALMLTEPDMLMTIINSALTLLQALADGLVDALPVLVDTIPVVIENIVTTLATHLPEILQAGGDILATLIMGIGGQEIELIKKMGELIGKLLDAIGEKGGDLLMAGEELIDDIKDGIKNKIDDAKAWGKDLIKNFTDGIKEKWQDLKDTVSDVAGSVKDFLGFSEPKKGPLSNFHTYAPDMMELFAKGVKDNEGVVTGQIAKSFDFGEQTIAAGVSASGAGGGGDITSILLAILSAIRDGKQIVLDGKTLVGATVNKYDTALATNSKMKTRGLA